MGSLLRVPFGARSLARGGGRAGRALRARPRAPGRARGGDRGRRRRRPGRARRLDGARVLLDAVARAAAHARPRRLGRHGRQARPRRRADRRRAAALADDEARLNDRQRGLLQALAERGPTVAAELGTPGLRRLESRGLVAIDRRPRPRRPVRHEVGSASATAPPLTTEQSGRPGPDRPGAARADARRPRVPAPRRHRIGQDRGLPRRGGGGAGGRAARRSCSCPRSRSPRRCCGAFRPASATSWPCCTRRSASASATTSGCACAPARRGCASARARRCSRRLTTSG